MPKGRKAAGPKNPAAAELRTPRFRQRRVAPAKAYDRRRLKAETRQLQKSLAATRDRDGGAFSLAG
jgi:hypothetical protein